MPTIRRFVVVPAVPEKLQALTELAYNLWTLWNYEASGLFRRLDPELWESTNHNPVRVLSLISQEKLAAAAADEPYPRRLSTLHVHPHVVRHQSQIQRQDRLFFRRVWAA